jgi:protein-L-isoaspartate(D-aspartate) O-methyltransferase
MIIPIGQPFKQGQVLYIYRKDENGKIHSRRDMGVFFIPMTGTMMNIPASAAKTTPS